MGCRTCYMLHLVAHVTCACDMCMHMHMHMHMHMCMHMYMCMCMHMCTSSHHNKAVTIIYKQYACAHSHN